MDLVIPKKKTYSIQIYEVDYVVTKPSTEQYEKFMDGVDGLSHVEQLRKSKALVASTGIPMEVLNQLELPHLTMLIEFFTDTLKKN